MIAQFTAWSHQDVETKQKIIWFSFTRIAAIRGGKMNPDKRSVRFCRTWTCNLCLLHDRGTVFSSSVSCHCLFVPSSNVLINPERLHSGVVNMSAILNFTLELCLVFSCLALTVDLLCLRITTSLPADPVRLHLHIKRCLIYLLYFTFILSLVLVLGPRVWPKQFVVCWWWDSKTEVRWLVILKDQASIVHVTNERTRNRFTKTAKDILLCITVVRPGTERSRYLQSNERSQRKGNAVRWSCDSRKSFHSDLPVDSSDNIANDSLSTVKKIIIFYYSYRFLARVGITYCTAATSEKLEKKTSHFTF